MHIGLALSGGAARGIAHIGVLEYLEERGVRPCCIAGTSAGSIVGAFYCSGMSVGKMKKIAAKMSWKDLIKISIPRKGLINSTLVLKIIEEHIGSITFEDLKIPLIVNAVDLLSGKEIIIDEGRVAKAVEASCAIPGIFTPVKKGSHLLVDGGLLDNLPAVHMKDRALDFVISVNVGAQKPLHEEPQSIFEILIQSYDIIRRHRDIPARQYSDILIEPDLGDISFFDTGKAELIIKRGYEACRQALGAIDLDRKPGLIRQWFKKRSKKKNSGPELF